MSAPVRSIAVVGSGVPACVAALALARAYGAMGLAVTLVDTERPVPAHAACAALPDIRAFHRLLGIEEKALLSAGAALSLGQQFVGWSDHGSAFLHAYGDAGRPFASLPFIQHWTRARLAGLRVVLEDFCLAAAAAKQGRIQVAADGPSMPYGYHIDTGRYAQLLRRHAEASGVVIRSDPASAPVTEGGRISALRLSSGETVEADLFVDADGTLIDALDLLGAEAEALPCDRIITASAPALDPLPLYARVTAHAGGYVTLLPLADRTAVELAYASDRMSDAEALSALASLAGLPILGHDAPRPIGRWRRRQRWMGNCVAIGGGTGSALDAAALLELQLSVGQLVLTLPIDRNDMSVEAGIYAAEVSGQADRIADFTAMHFHLNRREEPFWAAARAAPVSEELAAKVALFGARGMFAHFDHEAHVVDSWTLAMVGHGHLPGSYDPQANRVDEREAMAAFQGQLHTIARQVHAMPAHRQALAQLMGQGR